MRTRRSTSGGVILHGKHLIKHGSTLQTTVALSSGEAEIYACNKGASEGIGISQMCADFDVEKQVHMFTDASACKGAIMRRGTGRLKHIQVQELWLQECVRRGRIVVRKIGREDNCSDLLTHHWAAREAGNHLPKMGCRTSLRICRQGRVELAPQRSVACWAFFGSLGGVDCILWYLKADTSQGLGHLLVCRVGPDSNSPAGVRGFRGKPGLVRGRVFAGEELIA